MPEECSSFQKRLDGWAYAWPVDAVRRPGLRPMKRRARDGARDSVRLLAIGVGGKSWRVGVGVVPLVEVGVVRRRFGGGASALGPA